jgi:putative salt-induced outer membrane protein YdiY
MAMNKVSNFNSRKVLVAAVLLAMGLSVAAVGASAADEPWKGNVFAGYDQSNGNTKKGAATLSAQAEKKIGVNAILLKGSTTYSTTSGKMDGQKWDALAKYSFDFGQENKWFNFYQLFADHDYFADVNYRMTPSAGIGYHLAASPEWTWDADAGLGYRITRHRVNKAADDEALTALLHTFMKKSVFAKAYVSEDFTAYPGLTSGSGTLLKSETVFTNPLSEKLDLQLKYLVDHDTKAAGGKKKTDTRFIAGLKYSF